MRKTISLLVVLSILFTGFSLPVYASTQNTIVEMTTASLPTGLAVSNANTYTITAVNGYGGKQPSDEAALITGNPATGNVYFGYTYKIMTKDTAPYLVLEYDIMPGDGFKNFGFKTDTHAAFGPDLYTTDSTDTNKTRVLERNRWNRVTAVVENTIRTSGATLVQGTGTNGTDYVAGEEKTGIHKMYIYVNGKPIYPDSNGNAIGTLCPYLGYKWHNGSRWATGNAIRAAMYPEASNINYTGTFDNIRYYECDTFPVVEPEVLPEISDGEFYDVKGNEIIVQDTVAQKVSDIVAGEGVSVKAYTDATNKIELASTARLAQGNSVAVCDGRLVNYYTVTEKSAKTVVAHADTWAEFSKCKPGHSTSSKATGIGGKASNDESLCLETRDVVTNDGGEYKVGFVDFVWPQIAAGNLYTSGYLVTEYNIYIPSDSALYLDQISLFTNQNSAYGSSVSQNSLGTDKWNRILVYHDVVSQKAKMFVNGVLVQDNITSALNKATGKNSSRIFCGTITYKDGVSADNARWYIDDVSLYTTEVEPVPGCPPQLADTDDYIIYKETFVPLKQGLTVGDISVSEGMTARIVRDGALVSSTTAIANGDMVVVEDSDKQMTHYTVGVGTEIIKVSDNASNTTYGNAVTEEKLYGYAGKELSDESMKIRNTYKVSKKDGVETYSVDYNAWPNLGTFLWSDRKIEKSRYVVMEANINPDGGEKHIFFATNSHAVVSAITNELNIGQWNKFVTVIDMTNFEANTYLNGKLINTGTSAFKGTSSASAIRFSINMKPWYDANRGTTIPEQYPVYNTGRPVVDDMRVYESVSYPEITVPVELADKKVNGFEVKDNVVKAFLGKTVSDLKEAYVPDYRAVVYNPETNNVKAGTDYLEEGDVLAIDAGDETYSYYNIDVYGYNEIMSDTMYYDSENNVLNGSSISLSTVTEGEGVMLVAQYGEDDELQNVQYSYATDGKINMDFSLSNDKAEYLKVYLWNNLTSLVPLCEEKTIQLPQYENAIACWGDSLTYGQGATNIETESYPAVLGALTGIKTYNLGVAGETATTIASRQGAYDIRLTNNIVIPESGTVEIKFAAYEGDDYAGVVSPRADKGCWNPCFINGVEGTLTFEVDSSVWPRVIKWAKFTRKNPGEAVKCYAGDKFIPMAQNIKTDINVFFTGTNCAWTPENKNGGEDPLLLAELVKKQVAYANNNGKFVVLGLTSGDASKWVNENKALSEAFGEKFLDLKAYLLTDALADAGLTPTATDEADINKGHVPTSLLSSDGTHFNTIGYSVIASRVKAKMIELGYITE